MKSSFCIDLQRFMLIPTKFPLSRFPLPFLLWQVTKGRAMEGSEWHCLLLEDGERRPPSYYGLPRTVFAKILTV